MPKTTIEKLPQIEQYEHHNTNVFVQTALKGQHRYHCLCFQGCARFKPGHISNCVIADQVYQNCVDFNIVTPVWECPDYTDVPNPGPANRQQV